MCVCFVQFLVVILWTKERKMQKNNGAKRKVLLCARGNFGRCQKCKEECSGGWTQLRDWLKDCFYGSFCIDDLCTFAEGGTKLKHNRFWFVIWKQLLSVWFDSPKTADRFFFASLTLKLEFLNPQAHKLHRAPTEVWMPFSKQIQDLTQRNSDETWKTTVLLVFCRFSGDGHTYEHKTMAVCFCCRRTFVQHNDVIVADCQQWLKTMELCTKLLGCCWPVRDISPRTRPADHISAGFSSSPQSLRWKRRRRWWAPLSRLCLLLNALCSDELCCLSCRK